MADTLSVVLSGLAAQAQRLAATANNIANIGTVGALPTTESPASTVYKPLSVSYTALTAGGVSATVTEEPAGYSAAFDPTSIYANKDGLIAVPNTDLTKEIIIIMEAKLLFKANILVLKTQKEMLGELLNSIT